MAVYVISDPHLGLGCGKTMDKFGPEWEDHERKLRDGCAFLGEDDILVIPGDISWGNNLGSARADLEWILGTMHPWRIVLIRGNHDRWWPASRTGVLNAEFGQWGLFFLHKNFFPAGEYAIVGTKGYWPEGDVPPGQAEKLYVREAERLRESFSAAVGAGYGKFLCFTHYPPTLPGEEHSVFTEIAEHYGADVFCYGHLHGEERYGEGLSGTFRGVRYRLVSADHLRFTPVKVSESCVTKVSDLCEIKME